MSAIAAAIILAANLVDLSDPNMFASSDPSEIEAIFEGFMDSELQGDDIVLDDSLLIDLDAELQEIEE